MQRKNATWKLHVSVKLVQEYRTNALTAESKLAASENAAAAANCSVLTQVYVYCRVCIQVGHTGWIAKRCRCVLDGQVKNVEFVK